MAWTCKKFIFSLAYIKKIQNFFKVFIFSILCIIFYSFLPFAAVVFFYTLRKKSFFSQFFVSTRSVVRSLKLFSQFFSIFLQSPSFFQSFFSFLASFGSFSYLLAIFNQFSCSFFQKICVLRRQAYCDKNIKVSYGADLLSFY